MYHFRIPDTGDKIKQQTNQKLSYSLEYFYKAISINTYKSKSPSLFLCFSLTICICVYKIEELSSTSGKIEMFGIWL